MAKLDKEMLLKHHFWLLLPLALLFIMLAGLMAYSDVTDTTEQHTKDSQKGLDSLSGYAKDKPQPKQRIVKLQEVTGALDKSKTDLWKEAWEMQKEAGIFTWPSGLRWPAEAGFDEKTGMLKDQPFGASLDGIAYNEVRDKFSRPAYWEEFKALADSMAPIQFRTAANSLNSAPGWVNVLNPVGTESGWGDTNAYSEEMWLAMEDMWLKRHILRAIRRINDKAAQFSRGTDVEDPKIGPIGVFSNKVWDLSLWVEDPKGARLLRGKLVNKTPFLQPMSANNEMKFLVWFTPQRADEHPEDFRKRAFEYIVQGTGVPGVSKDGKTPKDDKTKLPINEYSIPVLNTPGKSHSIPLGLYGEKIALVEQVFDSRTTPVKWVDEIAVPFLSDRQAGIQLKMAAFSDKVSEKEGNILTPLVVPGAPTVAIAVDPAASGPDAPLPPTQIIDPRKPMWTAHNILRTRYFEANEQIRRIPVKVRLTVEQGYGLNILKEIVDSEKTKVPFQITQTEMNRVLDDFVPTSPMQASSDPSRPLDIGGDEADYDTFTTNFMNRLSTSSYAARPMTAGYPGAGAGITQLSQSGALGAPSLMEVTIYGIVSFYENFDYATKKAAAAAPAPTAPKQPAPKAGPTMPERK